MIVVDFPVGCIVVKVDDPAETFGEVRAGSVELLFVKVLDFFLAADDALFDFPSSNEERRILSRAFPR